MGFEAVIFDCDGVLVDSEPVTLQVLREMLAALGWSLTAAECETLFIGKAATDELHLIQERTGKKLGQDWIDEFRLRRNQALRSKLVAVPYIQETLERIRARWPTKIACASAADHPKIILQLEMVGLLSVFNGHIYSGADTPRNKPYPDVYVKAAHELGVSPHHCVIIEDSVTGITAGVAAGATVLAYDDKNTPTPLLDAGAVAVFTDMRELPPLIDAYCTNRGVSPSAEKTQVT